MSRARDNADLGDSYGSLAVGVTGGSGLNALSASNLSAGTVPDARFPATLPAASGTNLTALPAANVTGVLPVGVTGGSGLTAIAGVTTSANANAINIDASERVIMKAQPMMLATGFNSSDPSLTTSYQTITFLSASSTDCFLRGITYSSGVATVPIAGKYYVSVNFLVISLTAGDQVTILLSPSAHENRTSTHKGGSTYCKSSISGIFDMNASETLTLQMVNNTSSRGAVSNAKATARWSMLYIGE